MTKFPLLQISNGVIARDQNHLISHVNFSLHAGEIALLTGPNGSGKSTLLTALAGEKFLTEGALQFGSKLREEISLKEMAKKRSLMLQQDDAVNELRARDVLELVNISSDVPQYAQDFAARIFRNELGEKLLGTLSIGQRTRVFLAAAAIQNTEILLLDEPTAGLDSEGISDLVNFLEAYSSNGHSAILATHEDNLRPLANKECVISGRKLIVKLLR